MGQGGSTAAITGGRFYSGALTPQEYKALREALGVVEDVPEATVTLPAFLKCFPPHLRPLVQPLFFRLAADPGQRTARRRSGRRFDCDKMVAGVAAPSPSASPLGLPLDEEEEPSAPWPNIVAGIAQLVRAGASWPTLLEAWAGQDALEDPSAAAAARSEAAAELAAALCFWCAHPGLAPGPGAPGGVTPSAAAAALAGLDADPLESVVTPLRRPESNGSGGGGAYVSVKARLADAVPCLPQGVGPRLAQALLDAPAAPDCPAPASRVLDRGLAFLLRGSARPLWASGAWDLLYSDWRHGHSFTALLRGVLNYRGLAVLLIRVACSGEVLGVLSDHWDEGGAAFGGSADCLLFSLRPTLQVFRPTGRGRNFAYLNSRNKRAPRGLGFGGKPGAFRLWICPDLENGQVLQNDDSYTYAAGPLWTNSQAKDGFEIAHIEVWGLGGEPALAAQREKRSKELAGA